MNAPRSPAATFRPFGKADAAELQELFERCSDFFELTEGVPSRPTLAEEELTELAPGKTSDDTFPFGVYRDGRLSGFIHVTRHYPKPDEWWIGLLVLAPDARSRGFGSAVHEALRRWIASQSARVLWLGVLEHNTRAHRFWCHMGYVERERKQWVAPTGLASTMVLMSMPLMSITPELAE